MDKDFYIAYGLRIALSLLLYMTCLVYLFVPVCFLLNIPMLVSHILAFAVMAACYAGFPALFEKTFTVNWVDPEQDLPPAIYEFLLEATSINQIPLPKIGIIENKLPNIYSYGLFPGNARIVITSGMIDALEEDELKAVIASELGNIKSWSFVVLGTTLTLPLLCAEGIKKLLEKKKALGHVAIFPIGALYVILHCGLFFACPVSRFRNYYSDAFTCFVMDDINLLIQAIIKVISRTSNIVMSNDYEAVNLLAAIKPIGFIDHAFTGHLTLKSMDEASEEIETTAEIIKTDMRRPRLATELLGYSHMHPFLRIINLEESGIAMGLISNFDFRGMKLIAEGTGISYFFYEYMNILGFCSAVLLGIITGKMFSSTAIGLYNSFMLFTLVYAIKLYMSYPVTNFEDKNVDDLTHSLDEEIFSLTPVQMSGRIFPQFLPGKIFSSNAVLLDETGITILDFQKPLGFFEIFFRLIFSEKFKEENAVVRGWHRHFDVSTIEVNEIEFEDGQKIISPVYRNKIIFVFILLLLSIVFFTASHIGAGTP